MPASDVYSWAKASSKPSYAWTEISGKPSTFTPSSHTHSDINGDKIYTVDKSFTVKGNTGQIKLGTIATLTNNVIANTSKLIFMNCVILTGNVPGVLYFANNDIYLIIAIYNNMNYNNDISGTVRLYFVYKT